MGGGGGGQTQTQGIDPEFKPYVEKGLGISTDLLEGQQKDPSKIVAGLTPQQVDAISSQTLASQDMIQGRGAFDTQAAERRALQNLQGSAMGKAAYGGSLGSARADRAREAALADRAGGFQRERQKQVLGGIESLGKAGTTLQKQAQRELQAKDESLDRFFNRLTGVAGKTTTTSGGGK